MPLMLAQFAHDRHPPFNLRRCHSSVELCRRGAAARRVGKHVEIGQRQRFDKLKVPLELLSGFTRKTNYKICANCGVRHCLEDSFDALAKIISRITPAHSGEGKVFAGLQRQMEMWAKARALSHNCDDSVS